MPAPPGFGKAARQAAKSHENARILAFFNAIYATKPSKAAQHRVQPTRLRRAANAGRWAAKSQVAKPRTSIVRQSEMFEVEQIKHDAASFTIQALSGRPARNLAHYIRKKSEFMTGRMNMQRTKWQYCELTVQYGGLLTGVTCELTLFKSDGSMGHRQDKYSLVMAQLGLEGWELVSSTSIPASTLGYRQMTHFFKRELAE